MPQLAKKEYCTGCTARTYACPESCITITADKNGFLCPSVDLSKCISCGLCEKSCPIVTPLKINDNEPKAYAAYSNDESIRLSSSSGGIFTEIAYSVLDKNGAVFGAAYNDQFEVVHICVENKTDLTKLRGAKYAQSDLCGVFKDVKYRLEGGQDVLFSGTPCQIGGLKAYLHKEYENLITVDFVCHSVPSPMAWREYVKYRAQNDNGGKYPTAIDLRSKITGWSRYQYSNLFKYKNGVSHSVKSDESVYMKLFVGGYISRESCAECRFKGYSHISDFTIGDFCGIWDIAPDMDDNKGTSVVLVQSEKGAELLESISKRVITKAVTLEEASRQNHTMVKALQPNVQGIKIFELIRNGKIAECQNLLTTEKATLISYIKSIPKRIILKIKEK